MKVEKIDHVHIAVRDLEAATKFFSETLGVPFSAIREYKAADVRITMSPQGIELIQPLSPDGAVARFIEKRGEGLHAITLKVPNLEEAIAELQSKGLKLVGRVESDTMKEAQFHPKDAYGVMIELIESVPEHRKGWWGEGV